MTALARWAVLALLGLAPGLALGREPPPVHGWLTEVQGVPVLYAWGTPRDRGFAHGVLLRDRIIEVVDRYAVAQIGTGPYAVARALVGRTATVSPALRAEAEGVVAGLLAGGGAHIPSLERALDATDVLVLQAYTELAAVGCSSVSVWGRHSADGKARLVRNLDWSDAPALLRNQVVFVWGGEGMAQPVVSVGFAGYLGCLSCVSAAGTGAFFNMGYGQGAARPWELLKGFTPANLLLREALARGDVDGDGDADREDVAAALAAARHAGSYIVHAVDGQGALVVEVEADGHAVRTAADEPGGPPEALVATNHLRKKTAPTACRRDRLARRTLAKGPLSAEAQWALGERLALGSVVHSLQYTPATQRLRVRLRPAGGAPGEGPVATLGLGPMWGKVRAPAR